MLVFTIVLAKYFVGSGIRTYDGSPRTDLQSVALTTRPLLYHGLGQAERDLNHNLLQGTSVFKTGALNRSAIRLLCHPCE